MFSNRLSRTSGSQADPTPSPVSLGQRAVDQALAHCLVQIERVSGAGTHSRFLTVTPPPESKGGSPQRLRGTGRSVAKLTQAELERHLWQAADILRGTVDAGDYKQYIFGLLFYKRLCDVWDEEFEALLAETGDREEAADPDEHRFHIPPEHRWDQVRKQSTQIGQRLNNAFAAIEDANLRLRGVFGAVDFANQERFPDAVLEKLLSHFEKIGLRNADVPADVLGDAYLYLITMFAEGAGKKGGEFYTPRQVVRLIVECLDPQPGMSIYDPTCGSAGMLLESVQHLKDRGENPRSLSLFGQEKNLGTWAIAEINLFLHDIEVWRTCEHNIVERAGKGFGFSFGKVVARSSPRSVAGRNR